MRYIRPYLSFLKETAKSFMTEDDLLILEIGSGPGGSTRAFDDGLKERDQGKGHIFSVDIKDYAKRYDGKENITFIKEDSRSLKWGNYAVHVLFIDGDHSYEMAKHDYEKFMPYVVDGGLIIMHDVTFPTYGVKDFWKEITYPKVILPFNKAGLGVISKV